MSLDSSSNTTVAKNNIQDLIERFSRLGPNTDFNIIEQLLSRKDESLPYIIDIAQDDKYWFPEDGEYASWTPVCALHLLSVIGGTEAINAFIKSVKEYYDDTADWITEDMPAILANFGIEAFENIRNMLLNKDEVDMFVRAGAARALFLISEKYPDTREKSIKALRDAISFENDEVARSCFMYELVHFKDHDSLPFIEFYFKNDMINDGWMILDDVYQYYYESGSDSNSSLGNTMAKDSLDIFKDSPDNFYRNSNTGKYLPSTKSNNDYQPPSKKILKKEVGRNDPCPCGSGKKYKKCCLKIV
ncbi:MAG TPA: DUF1186 domain-containing protein [Nitrososphaeraceae archaeon]|nr:DUF1186 domain-containing protein [Nitrososphaeraceae archaeon]